MDFVVPADHSIKMKGSEKRDEYFAWELKNLYNIKVTVILIVIGTLSTVTKGLVQKLEDLEAREPEETIQTTVLWRATTIKKSLGNLRKFLTLKHQ